MVAEQVVAERFFLPTFGRRTAATVVFDPSGLVVVLADNVQTALVLVDGALVALGDVVAEALVEAAEALLVAEEALELAEDAGGALGPLEGLVAALDVRTRSVSSSLAAVTVANTAAEEEVLVAPIVVPFEVSEATTRPGDTLQVRAWGSLLNDSGAPVTFRPRVKMGGSTTVIDPGAGIAQPAAADPVPWSLTVDLLVRDGDDVELFARGCQGAAVPHGGWGERGVGPMDGVGQGAYGGDILDASDLSLTIEMGAADPAVSFTVEGWTVGLAKAPG